MRKIKVRWLKSEKDIAVFYDEGLKPDAGYILDYCFPKSVQDELIKRGLNIKTLKFSIETL